MDQLSVMFGSGSAEFLQVSWSTAVLLGEATISPVLLSRAGFTLDAAPDSWSHMENS